VNDLGFLSIGEAQQKIKDGNLSIKDLHNACLENIEETKELNIFTDYDNVPYKKDIIDESKSLYGIPVSVKDVFSTKKFTTTACSKILKGYQAPFDAEVVERILDNGSSIVGKVNTDEFTCGASTESSCYGYTKNPYDKSRVSGGSSGSLLQLELLCFHWGQIQEALFVNQLVSVM